MSYQEERSGEERRAGFCGVHHSNSSDLKEIKEALFDDVKPKVNSQSGQWKTFLWGAGIFASVFTAVFLFVAGVFFSSHEKSMESDRQLIETINKIDKTFTSYMAAHQQESIDGFRRIGRLENTITDHELRIDKLEKGR